jgi:isoquinoline 1-oxidoreductase beta subunit
MTTSFTRRDFLRTGAVSASSLVIGFYLPRRWMSDASESVPHVPSVPPFQPNAWLRIDPSGTISIWTGRSEMGQGVKTAMPMIVAEELEADWESVRVIQADADPAYGNQMTVGSRSVRSGWEPLRQAGAAAREMLISAAALTWGVPRSECTARAGTVRHTPSGRQLGYGQLTDRAAALPVPENPPLKQPSEYRILGTRVPRVDTPDKVRGRAKYGLDTRVPGMVFAAVARCPVFGGRVRTFDSGAALRVPGVTRVEQISSGVAVVAQNTWAAFQGKRALSIEWDEGATAQWSSEKIREAFAASSQLSAQTVRETGDVDSALSSGQLTAESIYEAPYLAHACMEPMNCTAHVKDGRAEIWAPTQNPQGIQREAMRILGLERDAVTVHVTYLGGGFGRRGGPTDYGTEAIELAQKLGMPVQLVWTREDDIRNGLYRPATYNVMRAALDEAGKPVAWSHKLVGPDGPSFMLTRGADELIYDIPNFRLEQVTEEPGIPIAPWRGVGPSQNGWVVESFVDELAHAAGKDPYAFRRELVAGKPRLLAVLDTAARAAGWGTPASEGHHKGIALWLFADTHVAEVAEVSVSDEGQVRVHKVTAAIDCGIVINPDGVESQTESNIVYGLTAALYGEITIEGGRVAQSNFHDYPMLRMAEMPEVEVHIVASDAAPSGIGEAALPAIAPAVCNAIFAATGKRIRKLPIGSVA